MYKLFEGMSRRNSIGALIADFSAYCVPVHSIPGTGRFADHTWVVGIESGGSCDIYVCACYGDNDNGSTHAPLLTSGQRDMHAVAMMINGDFHPKAYYGSWSDNCGILYAIHGVCHQMTNRILFTAAYSALDPLQDHVKGLIFSTLLYGVFGLNSGDFFRRVFNQQQVLNEINEEDGYQRFCESIDHKLNISELSALQKKLIRMELWETSTPSERFKVFYNEAFPQLEKDTVLDSLLDLLDDLVSAVKKLDPGTEVQETAVLNELAKSVNKAFMIFNAGAYKLLGDVKYKELFRCAYETDFNLCELLTEKTDN